MTRPTVKSILGDIGTSTSVLTRRPTVKQVLGETSVATQEKQTGFFQSMAQGIVKPFARGTANLASSLSSTFNLGQALIDKSKGNKEGYVNNMKQAAQKIEVDLGSYLGKYGPVGAGEKLSTQLKQGFGMGLEIGSWFIAGGGAKNLLKELGKAGLSKTTKQVLTKEIVKLGAKEGAKIGASAGGFGAGGAALAEKESTAGDVLKAGAIGATAGGVLGAGIGALGGKLSAKFARPKPIQPTAKPVVGATPITQKGVSKAISSELQPLAQEARKFKSADEFVDHYVKNPKEIPTSKEYKQFLSEKDAFIKKEEGLYAEMKSMRDKYTGKTIDQVPKQDIVKYEQLDVELKKTLSQKTLAKRPEGVIKTDIGDKALKEQLTDIYNQAVKGVDEAITKPSGVAKSIEAKSIEKGLTDSGFGQVAEYTPITIKQQSQLMSEIMTKDIELAKRIATGKEPLPPNLKGATAIKAMEDYAMETGDGLLARDLARSPLLKETSEAGQTLRLLAEREPDSATAKIREVALERTAVAEKKMKGLKPDKIKSEIKKGITEKVAKAKVNKYDWKNLISEIQC